MLDTTFRKPYQGSFEIAVYDCPNCGWTGDENAAIDDDYEGMLCPCEDCTTRLLYTHTRTVRWVTVAFYETDRSYGGPEEGGWWYTTGSVIPWTIRAYESGDFAQIAVYRDMMEQRLKAEGYDRLDFNVYKEKTAAAGFPSRRPFYC